MSDAIEKIRGEAASGVGVSAHLAYQPYQATVASDQPNSIIEEAKKSKFHDFAPANVFQQAQA